MSRPIRYFLTLLAFVLAALVLVAAGIAFWYTHRPLPEPVSNQTLFPGIFYSREIHTDPVPMIVHAVQIDLRTPGLSFLTTPRDHESSEFVYSARSVSQFLDEYDLQLAINGDYFDPWWMKGITDYYPHVGDGVNVNGLAVSEGEIVTTGYGRNVATLYITEDNRVSFSEPDAPIYTAISGNFTLLKDGKYALRADGDYITDRHPRTAVGLSEDGNTLILVVIDGRQPNYSGGATIPETAEFLLAYGAYAGINLDGGGSSTLVIEGANGQPEILSSPIQLYIPGMERPIANHFGVRIQR